jgi:hypothetical protein
MPDIFPTDFIEVFVTLPSGYRFQNVFAPELADEDDIWSGIRRKIELQLIDDSVTHE